MTPHDNRKSMAVSRRSGRCLNAVELRREGLVELLLTFRPSCQVDRLESLASFFGRIADYLAPYGVQIIQERCYGRADAYKEICARREVAYRQYGIDSDGAFFFIGQPPCDGSAVAGVQIWAAGPRGCVQPLSIGGEPVGTRYSDGSSSFTSFQNVGPCSGNGHARHDQAVDMFEKAGRLLETQGLSYRDVVRTWIYIPALLEWYGEFNAARRDVFRKSGLIDGKHPPAWLPASTGIQGLCPVGRSCMMGLMAVAPPDGAEYRRRAAALGENGIMMHSISDALCLTSELFSFQDFLLFCATEPELIRRLLDMMQGRVLAYTEALLATGFGPLFRICGPEYATPPYLPPERFREYVVAYDATLIDLIHRHGACARVHCHGRIAQVLDAILELGPDGLDPVEPPPDGDLALAEVKERTRGRVTLFGNLELKALEHGSADEVEDLTRRALRDGMPGGRFVIMPTAAPIGIPLSPGTEENYRRYIETALKHGAY
jgi:hypothetical protein